MRRRRVLIGVGAVVVLAIVVLALVPRGRTLSVRIAPVAYRDFRVTLPETGVVERPQTQAVPALVGGNIATLNVRAGDRVRAGQIVATIVNPEIESALLADRSAASAASARARSAVESNTVLPSQNRSAVVQAEANLQAAESTLSQSRSDLASGQQSGLGYGGQSAEDLRVQADATLAKAQTDLREAQRQYTANRDLYSQKAVSKDALDQTQARFEEARVAADQAAHERRILEGQLGRQRQTLQDRVRASEDAVRQAQASLDAARTTAAQGKQSDVDAAQADAARASEQYAYDNDQVARLTLRAPFGGIVETVASQPSDATRPLQPGDPISPGQPLVTIANGDRFVVRAKVDEQDIAAVRTGQRVRISGEDFGGASLGGHVAQISDVAQRSDDPSNTSRQITTTIALDRTLAFLRDGMTVDVDITTRLIPHSLVVPLDAIRHDGAKTYLFAVRKGVAKRLDVSLGATSDTEAVVRSGLAPGERIVVDRNLAVREGSAVAAAAPATPSATASGA